MRTIQEMEDRIKVLCDEIEVARVAGDASRVDQINNEINELVAAQTKLTGKPRSTSGTSRIVVPVPRGVRR